MQIVLTITKEYNTGNNNPIICWHYNSTFTEERERYRWYRYRGDWYSIWVIKNHYNISSFGLRFFQIVSKRFCRRKRNFFEIKTDCSFRKIFWEVLEELLLSKGSPATKTAIIKHCQLYTCYVTQWYTSSVNIAQISTQRCDSKALHFRCTVRSHY